VKRNCKIERLCMNMPPQFKQYMTYCRDLKFDEKPDYKYIKSLFENLFKDLKYEDDGNFDWVLHKQRLIERRKVAEEEERKSKELKNAKMRGKLGLKLMSKIAALEEEERKKKEEEHKRIEIEEIKKKAAMQENERQVDEDGKNYRHDIELQRKEMKEKIQAKIKTVIELEETNAKKTKEEEVKKPEIEYDPFEQELLKQARQLDVNGAV